VESIKGNNSKCRMWRQRCGGDEIKGIFKRVLVSINGCSNENDDDNGGNLILTYLAYCTTISHLLA